MAIAAKKEAVPRSQTPFPLEENGVVRGVVFPNNVRELRRKKGFETLRDFNPETDVSYTRLAKIERGEIYPTPDEMLTLANALNVGVGSLLVDTSDPSFNPEIWAREHIEASLENRGGDFEAMKLGAAMRVRRLSLGLSTTNLKDFGLPAATASRIENAERPINRWNRDVLKSIASFFKMKSIVEVQKYVDEMHAEGMLDDMLYNLFSSEAIEERRRKRLKALLSQVPADARSQAILANLDSHPKSFRPQKAKDAGSSESVPVPAAQSGQSSIYGGEEPARPEKPKLSATLKVLGKALPGGRINLDASDSVVVRPSGAGKDAFALRVPRASLGPGLPVGAVIVADPSVRVKNGNLAVIRNQKGNLAAIASIDIDQDGEMWALTSIGGKPFQLSQALTPDDEICAAIAVLID